jgi:hypothetical protein
MRRRGHNPPHGPSAGYCIVLVYNIFILKQKRYNRISGGYFLYHSTKNPCKKELQLKRRSGAIMILH